MKICIHIRNQVDTCNKNYVIADKGGGVPSNDYSISWGKGVLGSGQMVTVLHTREAVKNYLADFFR